MHRPHPPASRRDLSHRTSARRLLGLAFVLASLAVPLARAEIVDRIAAVVNDDVITLRELQRSAASSLASLGQLSNPALRAQEEQRALKKHLDELIGEQLLMQEAEKLRVTADRAQVDDYMARMREQYGWDEAGMTEALAREGSSVEEFRKDVRRRLTTSRLIQMKLGPTIRVSEEEVTEALEREYRGLAKEIELTARHILLLVPEGATKEQEEAIRAKTLALLEEVRKPGADFGALAQEHSQGPSAPKGGEIGSFTRGLLDPAFEQAAFSSEVGDIIGPVRTRYGFHIIQVTRRRELAPKDEEVLRREARARLRQKALEVAMKRWIQEMRRKAFVDVKLFDAAPATPTAATAGGPK